MSDWIWPLEALRATPSIKAGMTREQEMMCRREGIKLIMEIGGTLSCKANPTLAVASVYFHRFYMLQSMKKFPRELTAITCLFLAGKVEDFPKKCKDVCQAATNLYPLVYAGYPNLVDEVMGTERVLLHTLKFDLQVDLPYEALVEYSESFPMLTREQQIDSKQIGWTFLNDSFYTTLCITTDPQMIAIALLHLAFTVKNYRPIDQETDPCWWACDVTNWSVESVDKSCHLVLDFYTVTKEYPVLTNGNLIHI